VAGVGIARPIRYVAAMLKTTDGIVGAMRTRLTISFTLGLPKMKIMQKYTEILLFTSLFALAVPAFGIEVNTGTDEQARLPYWQVRNDMMSLRLVQRLPIQTRGFFLARGFSREQVERIAQSCVFQTVFKNISDTTANPSALHYNLNEWQIGYHGQARSLMTRQDWSAIWKQQQVKKPVKLAFKWALYPTYQEYKPGDYNWGMTLYGLKPGSVFDLKVVWHQAGQKHMARIDNIQCAEDINPQSGDVAE
jgi:hypothetical protein